MPTPGLRLAASSAVGLICLAGMQMAGVALAASLPASAALFAASMTLALALREIRPSSKAAQDAAPAVAAPSPVSSLARLPGLVTRHDRSGALLSIAGADAQAFGFSPDRIQPNAVIDRVHVAGRIGYLQAIDDLRRGAARARADVLFAVGGFENHYRPVRIEFVGECDEDGALKGFITQITDRGHEAALEEDAARARDEALGANEAKTRFLAAVSHELRTPLNAILGFSDILTGEYFGRFENEKQKEYCELINRSGKHLLAVVNAMLDMSKIEAGRYDLVKEPFDIGDAVAATEEMLALTARAKGVVLTTRVPRQLGDVSADRRAVQQVLINLANNAIKFTESGGVVTIDAARQGDKLVLTVADTGVGIAADKIGKLGQPFVQADSTYARHYEGAGLGLALVKGLVALHGGSFSIESELGAGTKVTVILPFEGEDGVDNAIEFPPRLVERARTQTIEETLHGAAEAKIA
ncbi:ATP-binding protein [Rhizobium sp. FKL33]|uniref:sensor histidine kinase n=1 Tax=Rhizobium sp. FKL33 TaxID=2562307 RepID=UPI0010C00951|nr:ATP-binding protein [Rhizobium sp. FKL33]